MAFHVRQADDVPAARAAVLAAITTVEAREALGDHGLAPYRGRSVVDLRPGNAGGKGEAMARLLERHAPTAAIAFGDDLSDSDGFEAIHDAVSTGRLVTGVAVGVHGRGSAAPAEVLARSDLVVASAPAVGRILAGLARRLQA